MTHPCLRLGLFLLAATQHLPAASLKALSAARQWERAEWRIADAPTATNNFDPELIRLDAVFTAPSKRVLTVPAFWYQDYTRTRVKGDQTLAPRGAPEWRVRFTPDEIGEYSVAISVHASGKPAGQSDALNFTVAPPAPGTAGGWVRTVPASRFFATSTGLPVRLNGANACWSGPHGTYDFDEWFPAMRSAGWNFVRLWMAPWAMGLEQQPGTLNRYDLGAAWHLDHVLELAEQNGLYVLLALDFHGMFMVSDPAWGGMNNFWKTNSPYASENGGPCASPNEFFTSATARKIYQKRLRYLIGRYGYSPRLLAWQFFNEIDNSYRPRSDLAGQDVVAWHREMGRWLREYDPYRHLVSTSLTGGSERPEFWSLPEMDFSVYHSYGEADPARNIAKRSADMFRRYGKPVMIGEFGTDFRNWTLAADPYLRGFRQGLWGGVLGASVGSSMSWWWEDLHRDRVYPLYAALGQIMARAGWDRGEWSPAELADSAPAPLDLAEPDPGGEPFNATIAINPLRLNRVSGSTSLAHPLDAARAAERISSYLHGTGNPQLQQHARLQAWFADGARLVFRVNSIAADADLLVRVDGAEKLRVPLVNRDGLATLNDEIDREFTLDLPAGRRTVEIAHTGADWVNLKSVRLERLLPAGDGGARRFQVEAIGLRRNETAVLYVRSPHVAWPAGALRYNPPVVHAATVELRDWTAGAGGVVWFDPKTGGELSAGAVSGKEGSLQLEIPDFTEDLVAIVTAGPGARAQP